MKSISDNLIARKSFLFILLTIAGFNLVYYSIYIFQFPQFIFDDYYIFYRIKTNPDLLFSLNPNEKFFLFCPTNNLSLLFFSIQYYTWQCNCHEINKFSSLYM